MVTAMSLALPGPGYTRPGLQLGSIGPGWELVRGMASSSPLQTESVFTRSLGDADFCEIPVEQVVIMLTWSAFLGGGAGCAPARMSGGGAWGRKSWFQQKS